MKKVKLHINNKYSEQKQQPSLLSNSRSQSMTKLSTLPQLLNNSKFMLRLSKRIDMNIGHIDPVKKFGLNSSQNDHIIQIVDKLYYQALNNQQIGEYFVRISRDKYCKKFTQYLRMLFKEDVFLQMDQVQKAHNFGLYSHFYIVFKKILFKIIFNTQNNVLTVFQGCKRVQKFRLCIATNNQYTNSGFVDQIYGSLKRIIGGSSDLIQCFVEFLFKTHNLTKLVQEIRISKIDLDSKQYLLIKSLILDVSFKIKIKTQLVQASLQNLLMIKYLFFNRRSMIQHIEFKYKSINNFIAKLFNQPSYKKKQHQKELKIIRIILLHIFDTRQINFTQAELVHITDITNKSIDHFFIDQLFVQFLHFIKAEAFAQEYYSQIVFKVRRIRRLVRLKSIDPLKLQKFQDFLQNLRQKKLDKVLRGRSKLCPIRMQAMYFMHQQLYDQQQLRLIHHQVRMDQASLQSLKQVILSEHQIYFPDEVVQHRNIQKQLRKCESLFSI